MVFNPRGLNRLLAKHGRDITLSVPSGAGTYDPDTGGYSSDRQIYTVRGYFYSFNDDAIDGDTIQSGDSKVVVKATQYNGLPIPKPDSSSKVYYWSDLWSVVSVGTIWSGQDPLCYILHIRN